MAGNRGAWLAGAGVLALLGLAQFALLQRDHRKPAPKPPEPPLTPFTPEAMAKAAEGWVKTAGAELEEWGPVINALTACSALKPWADAAMVGDDEARWGVHREIDPNVIFGINVMQDRPNKAFTEEQAVRLLETLTDDPSPMNGRVLVGLLEWLNPPVQTNSANPAIGRGRRLAELIDKAKLPSEIVVEDAFLRPWSRSGFDLGLLPAGLLNRIVFRRSFLTLCPIHVREKVRLRFEDCALMGIAVREQAGGVVEIEAQNCLITGSFSVREGRILAGNSLFGRVQMDLSGDAAKRSDISSSIGFAVDADPLVWKALGLHEGGWSSGAGRIDDKHRARLMEKGMLLPREQETLAAVK